MRDIASDESLKESITFVHIKSKEEIMEWISDDVLTRFMKIYNDLKNPKLSAFEKFRILVENHQFTEMYNNVKMFDVFYQYL